MRRAGLTILALVVLGASYATVRLKYFNVDQDGNAFVIKWETEQEDQVSTFEVFRKAGFDAEFVKVGALDGHGINLIYELRDEDVYKNSGNSGSAYIDYRLDVVYDNGLRQRLAEKKVNYTSTAVRRTWGSIKAMFQ